MTTRRIILAGGTGFLGRALAEHFGAARWDVVVLGRAHTAGDFQGCYLQWDAETLGPWQGELESASAVVNLTGKSVNCRYNPRNRREILESRVKSTRVIGEAIADCRKPPPVWFNSSTATIYRHTYGDAWDEAGEIRAEEKAKDAFSVEVAKAWEQAFVDAQTPGTRKIAMRTAMVLGYAKNSVFPMLRRLTTLGLGGKMGTGRQFVSWIHQLDFCRAVDWLIEHPALKGAINIAAPSPLPNQEMMRTLRNACGFPFGLPAPAPLVEMGAFLLGTETELILKSRRVVPRRLLESGFQFRFPTLREAFEDLAGRSPSVSA